jgi:hypothetical protein
MNIDLSNMTPELKAALMQSLIASTFSSKTFHAIGDNLARGIIKTTEVAAKYSGTVEAMAVPTAMKAFGIAKAVVVDLSGRVVDGVNAGYIVATAPRSSSTSVSA